ncbi:GATA zinc finger domain-containing protein 14, partial [Trichogramma pretiosum]|uniref:GATA zinc finger domain-containing protein 14 n=1 Tax=Trichogramma pretiosum TaxID=7493 RepID=UPI000C71C292
FRIDNTDHIIDVNKNNAAFEYDQVNIICPVYQPGTYDDEAEKYIIYNVSKEEYETCRITNPSPRVIAICDKPFKTMYFTITFRPFTPQPGGLEFHPGRDYYFISTSSRDDLHRRIGGRCTTHNMKVVFKVCCNEQDQPNYVPSRNNSISVTSSTMSTSSSSTSTSIIGQHGGQANNGISNGMPPAPLPPSVYKGSNDRFYPSNVLNNGPGGSSNNNNNNNRDHTGMSNINNNNRDEHPTNNNQDNAVVPPTLSHIPQVPMFPNYPHQQPQPPVYGGRDHGLLPASQPPKTSITKKKNKEYSDHPNEVVKNEELTYNAASSRTLQRTSRWTSLLLAAAVALLPYLLR